MKFCRKHSFDALISLPIFKKINSFYKKNKSVILYIFFGGLTTVVSIAVFILCDSVLLINELVSNVVSWIAAVTFAYFTNRKWVFNSKSKGKDFFREIISFYSGRISTLLVEEVILLIFVTILKLNSTALKISAQVLVLILNYLISKMFVFKEDINE